MPIKETAWKAYYPDDGETADDAGNIKVYDWQKIYDKEDAAKYACECDYSSRDGWERNESAFRIVVIDPEGNEHYFKGWHEPSVNHIVEEIYKDEEV